VKLFIISSRYPYPIEKGDKLRLYHQIQQLSKEFDIVLVSLTDQVVSELGISRLKPYCRSIHVFRLSKKAITGNLIKGYFKSLPAQVSYFLNQEIKENILNLIKTEAPDHIYCQLIRTSEYVKDLTIPKTLDYMDSFSLNTYKRSLNSSFLTRWFWKLESNLLGKYETRIYPYFDQHTIISPIDAAWIQSKHGLPINLIFNGLDYRFFKDAHAHKDIDVLFLGNLSYFSNINAVQYLINDIMPVLNKKNKDLRLVIAGAQPQRNLIRLIHKHAPKVL
jgi:hypothetical protein